jgi:hypothetical protein
MILGELCNFAGPFKLSPKSFDVNFQLTVTTAYAFVEAIVVVSSISPLSQARSRFDHWSLTSAFQTPLGALSVVISAVLSSIFLKEKLTFFGWLGCALCVVRHEFTKPSSRLSPQR